MRKVLLAALVLLLAAPCGSRGLPPVKTGNQSDPSANSADYRELERLWEGLAAEDLEQARKAAGQLAAAGDRAVAFLKNRLQPVLSPDPARIKQLVANLNHEEYPVREAASEELSMLGRSVEPVLRSTLQADPPPETRYRIKKLLDDCASPFPVERGARRVVMAVGVLELVGTEQAGQVLAAMTAVGTAPCLKYYRAGGYELQAGFVPDKLAYVFGEPVLHITFVVKNLTGKPILFPIGGDYRGIGRPSRFSVTAVDAAESKVRDPRASYSCFGGMASNQTLHVGETYIERLFVPNWLEFEKPGVHTVTCQRTLNIGKDIRKRKEEQEQPQVDVPTVTTFQLIIEPSDKERIREIIDRLVETIRTGSGQPREDALVALTYVKDEAVIPELAKLLTFAAREHRISALEALSDFATEEAAAAILGTVRDGDRGIPVSRTEGTGIDVIRRHGRWRAAPALIRCMDMANPSVRNYLNYTLVWKTGACGGPGLAYHHDFDSEGTDKQIADNRRTLEAMKNWLTQFEQTQAAKLELEDSLFSAAEARALTAKRRRWDRKKATGALSGHVYLPDGKAPAVGFMVAPFSLNTPWPEVTNSGGAEGLVYRSNEYLSVSTGDDGSFTIKGLRPGRYGLYVAPRRLRDSGGWGPRDPELAKYLPTMSELMDVKQDNETGSVSIVLAVGGRLVGTVSDADTGKPVLKAKVDPVSIELHKELPFYRTWSAWTDEHGRFSLQGLPSATYEFFVSAPGYQILHIDRRKGIAIKAPQEKTFNLELRRARQ